MRAGGGGEGSVRGAEADNAHAPCRILFPSPSDGVGDAQFGDREVGFLSGGSGPVVRKIPPTILPCLPAFS